MDKTIWLIINGIPSRTENVKRLSNKLLSLNQRVQIIGLKTDEDNEKGKFNSHISGIRYCYENNYEYCAIIEDDSSYTDNLSMENLGKIHQFLNNRDEPFILHLNHFHDIKNYTADKLNDNVYKIKSIFSNVYIMNRPMMELIKDYKYVGTNIDSIFYGINNSYGFYPILFIQGSQFRTNKSYINEHVWNKIPRIAKEFYNTATEFYTKHITIPVKTIGLALFAISILFMFGYLNDIRLPLSISVVILMLLCNIRT